MRYEGGHTMRGGYVEVRKEICEVYKPGVQILFG